MTSTGCAPVASDLRVVLPQSTCHAGLGHASRSTRTHLGGATSCGYQSCARPEATRHGACELVNCDGESFCMSRIRESFCMSRIGRQAWRSCILGCPANFACLVSIRTLHAPAGYKMTHIATLAVCSLQPGMQETLLKGSLKLQAMYIFAEGPALDGRSFIAVCNVSPAAAL